jgi:hypothetical protein
VEGHPLNPYLKFLISKLEEAKKREEEEKEKANEFALSLVSEYNDEEEPFKTEETDTAEAVVADERPTDNVPSLEPKQSYVAMFDFTPEKDGEMSMKVRLPPVLLRSGVSVLWLLERALTVFRIDGRSAGGS